MAEVRPDIELEFERQLQTLREGNEERLIRQKLSNLEELVAAERKANKDTVRARMQDTDDWQASYLDHIKKRQNAERNQMNALMTAAADQMQAMGMTLDQIFKSEEERLADIRREEEALIAAAGNDNAKKEAIRKEYAAKLEAEKLIQKEKDKINKKANEKFHKQRLKEATEIAAAHFKSPVSLLTKASKQEAIEALQAEMGESFDADLAEKAIKQAQSQALFNFGDKLAKKGAEIALNQAAIDTRLQGSSYGINGNFAWRDIDLKIGAAVGVSPFLKQEKVVSNLQTLVGQGIAFNVEQRAFLQTVSEKIATTFNAADGTLLKLVRIQQADTTAARLGMESALTAFLNNMYSTSEYMTEAAASIRSSIYEASALMGATEATAFEYQVQKWMGSLHSVGFSNTEGLAGAFGKLVAGDISAITGGGYGNLLVMAANAAGLSVAQILEKGLDESETNKLFEAMVGYLSDIYTETKGSRVVAQQYANVFGVTASDLKAAANLSSSVGNISKNSLSYSGMMGQLNSMANSMVLRTSMGEMMENIMGNFIYSMSASMGNNPVLYLTHNIAKMLGDTTGGIALPFINAMGFGVDLNTTVANLMEVAAVSGSVLGGLGKLLVSLGSAGGFSGSGMLRMMGIKDGVSTITRGTGVGLKTDSGVTISQSGFVGNENAEDIKAKTLADASREPNEQLEVAKAEAADIKLLQVDEHVVDIYELLLDVTSGARAFYVKTQLNDGPGSWTV